MVPLKPEALTYSINCVYGICQNNLSRSNIFFILVFCALSIFYMVRNIILYFAVFELFFFSICLFFLLSFLSYIVVLYFEHFESGKFPSVVKDILLQLMRLHLLMLIMDLGIQHKMKSSKLSVLDACGNPNYASVCQYTNHTSSHIAQYFTQCQWLLLHTSVPLTIILFKFKYCL